MVGPPLYGSRSPAPSPYRPFAGVRNSCRHSNGEQMRSSQDGSGRVSSTEREVFDQMDKDDQDVAVESASIHIETGSHPMRLLYVPSTSGGGRPSSRRIFESVRRKPSRSVGATVGGGKSRTSTRASSTISLRRHRRKTTAFACSTSCSQCSCTISGGSPTSCCKRTSTVRWTTRLCLPRG